MSTLARYALFQVPGWIVTAAILMIPWELGWLNLEVAAILFGLLILKDALVYPFVRRAYEPVGSNRVEELIGQLAEVRHELRPEGFVWVRGELWRAEAEDDTIATGNRVRVVRTRGLTLIVERETT
jgi:membrane-bound serine protease (ClpP class)